MTAVQMGLTIAVCTAATMLTRFLPFLIFSSKEQQPPEVVRYLGRVLPAAIFGMLIVYCLKGVTPFSGSHGIPEAIALLNYFGYKYIVFAVPKQTEGEQDHDRSSTD